MKMNTTLVALNGKGSFKAYMLENGVVVEVNSRTFIVQFDLNDTAYIGIDGSKYLVTWF